MAYFDFEFFSASLMRNARVRAYLPNDQPPFATRGNAAYERPAKTLVLLNGYTASGAEWAWSSVAANVAAAHNLAVLMPDGENSFYLDRGRTGAQWGTYVAEELPAYAQRTFGLSAERADNFVGGDSMGGFGALHAGLAHPERFAGILALSPAMILRDVAQMAPGGGNQFGDYAFFRSTFGEPSEVLGSGRDPEALAAGLNEAGEDAPKVFLAVGADDFLYGRVQETRAALAAAGVEVAYEEGPGGHDFAFWNRHLEPGVRALLGE